MNEAAGLTVVPLLRKPLSGFGFTFASTKRSPASPLAHINKHTGPNYPVTFLVFCN
jgi:hypothetical protein